MKVQNKNASSMQTSDKIKTAFIDLIKEKKSGDKLTVTEIVKKAGINRTTFYTHYDDLSDVALEIEADMLGEIEDIKPSNKEEIYSYLINICNYIKNNEIITHIIKTAENPTYILSKLRNGIIKTFSKIFNISQNKYTKMKIEMFVDGMIFQLVQYIKGVSTYTYEELLNGILLQAKENI